MQIRRFANSIVTRLTLIALLIVILGSGLRYFFLTTLLREDLESLVSGQQLAMAQFVARDIDYKLRERQTLLERIAQQLPPDLLSEQEKLRAWLSERHELLPFFFIRLSVINLEGEAIADSPQFSGRPARNFRHDGAFAAAREGKPGGYKSGIDVESKQAALPLATPIRDKSGAVSAVLIGSISLSAEDFFNVSKNSRIGKSGGVLVIAPQDKLFILATDPSMILRPTPPVGVNLLHDRAMEGYRGTGITVNAKGIEELSAIASIPSSEWFVVARIPTAEAFAAIGRTTTYLLRISLIVLALALALVSALTWWVLKPLFNAARQADEMTRGAADLQPLRVERDDEVGHLTAAFNRLLTKLVNSQAELLRLAYHDSLTGLPNRRLLADRLRQALARGQRNKTHVAVLAMDLDHFKSINDTRGHKSGDETLRIAAERFAAVLRVEDTLARVGGDEFVLLLTDLAGAPEDIAKRVELIASKCVDIASRPMTVHGAEIALGVSIGIAICGGECSPAQLMSASDKAMYEAKRTGRGRWVFAERIIESVS